MMYYRYALSFTLSLIFFSSCPKPEPEPVFSHTLIAKNYLREVMDIMEENSINRFRIDWTEFRTAVLTETDGALTVEDTYPGIQKALDLLQDNHSFFVVPDGTSGFASGEYTCGQESITETSWPDHIGYVKVEKFSGGANTPEAISYATDLQAQMMLQDNEEIIGWIVDLRGNIGGNMWPMLAGIGPVLGEGTAGYFVNPSGDSRSWGYANGAAVFNGTTLYSEVPDPYRLIKENPKVAVLLNQSIASSGEAIAVSFISRDNTRHFGQATCGLSTSNSVFRLSDGAFLYLTTDYFADRNITIYGTPIAPDQEVGNDNILQAAVEWLEN